MPKNIVKLVIFGVTALLLAGGMVLLGGQAEAQSLPRVEKMTAERALGNKDAKVTVVEYASLTCPHCASFYNGPWQALKKEFVDSGKVKFIYRDFPLDRVALAASMIARCTPEERYFGIIELMFKAQDSWRRAANPQAALANIGRLAGMSKDTIQACLQNQAVFDAVMKQRNAGDQQYNVEATPTFLVNGEKVETQRILEDYRNVLNQALAKAGN